MPVKQIDYVLDEDGLKDLLTSRQDDLDVVFVGHGSLSTSM